MKRERLAKLGRGTDALDSAWSDYRKAPNKYAYGDLMKFVPQGQRSAWHEKALDAAEGSNLQSHLELLVELHEDDRLVEFIRQSTDAALEGASHYATHPLAEKLEKTHPELAARLWCSQGMRVVKAKKSRYYDATLAAFDRARRCFEKADRAADWKRVVERVRAEHQRKYGFMSQFEELVARAGPVEKPSFLERAKARWGSTSE